MPNRSIDYEKELNAEQLQVVTQGDGAVLVLAGAGSGKTRTITYRVAYLLEQGVLPQEILLLTFTNKAAKEMLSRVSSLIEYEPKGLWGGTFHSVASRLLRLYANDIGYTQNFTILDQEDAHLLMKVGLKELSVDTTAKRFPSPSKLCGIISYARNAGSSLARVIEQKYPSLSEKISIIERLAEVYTLHKQQANAMDFDDLLINLRKLLFEQPLIRQRLSQQFRYILVDEYQDTNTIQAEIVKQLSECHRNVLVVGDDAQSIYSFRAAEIKNILRFSDSYPDANIFRLTTNYRSTPQILEVANRSIQNNRDQFEKTLLAVNADQKKPQLVPQATAAQEASYITTTVLDLHRQGIPFSEMAVLFRASFHSQALEFELMKRGISYEYRGGLKFFERAHVKDVIAYLRIRANISDEAAWLRVLGLQPGVGLATAQRILSCVQNMEDLNQVCSAEMKLSKRVAAGWSDLREVLRKLSHESHPADLIRTVITSDYRVYLEAEYPDFMDRLEDLEQFALFAEQTQELSEFLQNISLTDEFGVKNADQFLGEDRMILSTIHQAKGLEWDTVFVINLADGKFPNPRALDEEGGLEEERRLFYVATTRARKRLIYTYALTSGYDTMLLQQPSMFLQELPEELFEYVRTSSVASEFSPRQEESIIVFDDLGERVSTDISTTKSFLRNIDDL